MMRHSTTTQLIRTTVLVAALSAPAQASAFFWSGPGCMMANMLGMGNFTGGLHFSLGSGGHGAGRGLGYGYGYPYGYQHPGGPPHPFAYSPPRMSPAAEPPARSTRSARDILEANIWSERTTDLQPAEAEDRNMAPPNRWRHGR
jgi:hypothetical protein